MRRILNLLADYRTVQLQQMGAPEAKLQEVEPMFRYLDDELSFVGRSPTATGNKMEEVMTSAAFTYAIQTFIQRRLEPAYTKKNFDFEQFTAMDTTPNYLPVQRYQRRAALDDLEYVGSKGEARPGSVVDATQRQFQVYDWEKQYDFSFHALVNDDLGYFDDLATEMGLAARRTLERFVSRMYTNATSVGRLTGLGALWSTTGRLTTARISTARMAFNQRVDARANPINASLRYIVYHSGLVDTVRTIRQSQLVPELATNAANVIAGDFIPVEDPHIAGTAPNLPWWAFTDFRSNNIKPLVLARWQGMPSPVLARKTSDMEAITSLTGGGTPMQPILGDFSTGNVVVKVWDVWGVYVDGTEGNLYDNRGAYYSSGTAP